MNTLWLEILILQNLIGYSFAIANMFIGSYNIRDLGKMKEDSAITHGHKAFGLIGSFFFYAILLQYIIIIIQEGIINTIFYSNSGPTRVNILTGALLGVILFTIKAFYSIFKKKVIYKYGQILGFFGFIGWSLFYWTVFIKYYSDIINYILPIIGMEITQFIFAAILPILIGLCIFLGVLVIRERKSDKGKWISRQITFILHGITFGYEKTANDLLGTPALFRFVVPRTHEFVKKLINGFNLNIDELKQLNVSDAVELFTNKINSIRMSERIKIKWESEKILSIKSINCSTAKIQNIANQNSYNNAICPWAIMIASLINICTGKDLEIGDSEFSNKNAKIRLKID